MPCLLTTRLAKIKRMKSNTYYYFFIDKYIFIWGNPPPSSPLLPCSSLWISCRIGSPWLLRACTFAGARAQSFPPSSLVAHRQIGCGGQQIGLRCSPPRCLPRPPPHRAGVVGTFVLSLARGMPHCQLRLHIPASTGMPPPHWSRPPPHWSRPPPHWDASPQLLDLARWTDSLVNPACCRLASPPRLPSLPLASGPPPPVRHQLPCHFPAISASIDAPPCLLILSQHTTALPRLRLIGLAPAASSGHLAPPLLSLDRNQPRLVRP